MTEKNKSEKKEGEKQLNNCGDGGGGGGGGDGDDEDDDVPLFCSIAISAHKSTAKLDIQIRPFSFKFFTSIPFTLPHTFLRSLV